MATNGDLLRYVRLQDALLARRAERSLRDFVQEFWSVLEPDRQFMSTWHIDLLCEHLEAVSYTHLTLPTILRV